MKKEAIFIVVLALGVGILIGIIYANWKRDTAAPVENRSTGATPAAQTAPVVNYQQQIVALEGLAERDPDNRKIWVQLGHVFFDAKEPMKAIDAYGRALELDPHDADVLTDQGIMFRRVGWFDRAVENFRKAGEIDPAHAQSLYNLGIVYRYDIKDFDAAIAAWTTLIEKNPGLSGLEQIKQEIEFLKTHPQLPEQQSLSPQ